MGSRTRGEVLGAPHPPSAVRPSLDLLWVASPACGASSRVAELDPGGFPSQECIDLCGKRSMLTAHHIWAPPRITGRTQSPHPAGYCCPRSACTS